MEHKVLRTGFVAGFLGALALVVALVAGVRPAPWVQLLGAFSLLSAFACLFWAEATLDKLDRQLLELGTTINELAEENHKARKALADYILIAQLGAAFGGRVPPHRSGPQSLLCPACARPDCPGIRGVDLCPSWLEAETRNDRGEYLPTRPAQVFEDKGGPAGPVEWPKPITERARDLDPDAWGLTAELPDTEEDTTP